jgi:hypothetical protein
MSNIPYYFSTDLNTVRLCKEPLREKFHLAPPTDPNCCQSGKLVWENADGLGIYRIDFIEEPPTVIFRYWDQRYIPKRDGKPMEEAIKFFVQNYPYTRVTDSLCNDLELRLD